jgi:outer membrane lipoprotein-sorting protein
MIPITKEGALAKGAEYMIKEYKFKEYPGGIWFPSEGVSRTFLIEETGEKKELSRNIMKVEDFQINIDIADDVFKPTLKKGTIVHDRRTGSSYTVE